MMSKPKKSEEEEDYFSLTYHQELVTKPVSGQYTNGYLLLV
jgi:hypothetical protein